MICKYRIQISKLFKPYMDCLVIEIRIWARPYGTIRPRVLPTYMLAYRPDTQRFLADTQLKLPFWNIFIVLLTFDRGYNIPCIVINFLVFLSVTQSLSSASLSIPRAVRDLLQALQDTYNFLLHPTPSVVCHLVKQFHPNVPFYPSSRSSQHISPDQTSAMSSLKIRTVCTNESTSFSFFADNFRSSMINPASILRHIISSTNLPQNHRQKEQHQNKQRWRQIITLEKVQTFHNPRMWYHVACLLVVYPCHGQINFHVPTVL